MEQFIVDDGKIKCLITGKLRKETPEEYIRQEFIRILLNVYKYPKAQMDVEFPIKMGSQNKRVDIVVFNDEKKTQDNIYIVVETKKKQETDGVDQLYSYMSSTTANFGVWTNGEKIVYLLREQGIPNKFSELPDVPKFKENMEEIGKYKKSDLVKCTDLRGIFVKCNNYFYTNQGLTPDKRFAEIIKIIFCKTEDEKNLLNEKANFYITLKEKESEAGIKNFKLRIDKLFENVKDRYKKDNIFEKYDQIILNDRCLSFAVAEFQKYSLIETDVDIKGVAFETFVGKNFRGEHGEFFTPREVVRLAAESILPQINETVCDPACGSGGFLVMILKNILKQYQELSGKNKNLNADVLFKEYADSYIRGIDFNPDLARVSKMNMVLNNDGHSGVFHWDSLTPFDKWNARILEKIQPGAINIILTNPPFGKKCVIDDKKILMSFELGYKWKKDSGRWVRTDTVEESRTPDILFIERCLQLLKPNGRMAIVLPDGILGNDGMEFVRQYILDKTFIIGIIDLPVEAFLPNVDTKTSLVILKKKENKDIQQTFDIFMAIAKTCGHDRRGNILYKRDNDGNIMFDDLGQPIIDNDLVEVTNELVKYAESNNLYY